MALTQQEIPKGNPVREIFRKRKVKYDMQKQLDIVS